jgi:hypothetical protein
MNEFNKALDDIAALRSQVARSSEFLGYGPTTLAATSGIAVIAAVAQRYLIPQPASDVVAYLALWVCAAGLSMILIAVEVVTRSKRAHSGLANEMVMSAVEQLLPAVAAGVLLTCVMARSASESLWMLPGLWQILLSLGLYASARSVPRPMILTGGWYLCSGLACIAFAHGDDAFSPIAMGASFGVGQLIAAVLIHQQSRLREDV